MMLDGTLCQVCGIYMSQEELKLIGLEDSEEAPGFPVTCRDCQEN